MKRLLITTFLMFLIAGGFYMVIMYALNHTEFRGRRLALATIPYLQRTGGQEARMFEDLVGKEVPEIVVIGSSHAYRGYDPRIFSAVGLEMINTGTSSQHSMASYLLTVEYWKYDSRPLFIIDVYPQVFMDEGMECTTRLIQNVPSDSIAWQLVAREPDLRSFNAWMARQCCDLSVKEFDAVGYIEKGYCSTEDTLRNLILPCDSIFSPRSIYFDYLHKLMSLLEHRGCRYILVNQPMPINACYAVANDDFNDNLRELHDLHIFEYLDMSEDTGFDVSCDFSDPRHLNQAGVAKFNQILIDTLRSKGYFAQEGMDGSTSLNVDKSLQCYASLIL